MREVKSASWAKGWDAERLQQELNQHPRMVVGFKRRSRWTGSLRLGKTYGRLNQGPVIACTDQAVHLSYSPTFMNFSCPRGSRVLYLGVMRAYRGPVKRIGPNTKWAGRKYTLVAKFDLTLSVRNFRGGGGRYGFLSLLGLEDIR